MSQIYSGCSLPEAVARTISTASTTGLFQLLIHALHAILVCHATITSQGKAAKKTTAMQETAPGSQYQTSSGQGSASARILATASGATAPVQKACKVQGQQAWFLSSAPGTRQKSSRHHQT